MSSNNKSDSDIIDIKGADMDQLILNTIGTEIKKQRQDAQSILSYAFFAGLFVILLIFVTMAPEIAKRFTPELTKAIEEKNIIISNEIKNFENKFSTIFEELPKYEFNKLSDKDKKKKIYLERNRISELDKGPITQLRIANFIKNMNIDKEKINVAFTILPIVFVAMFAGSLFTYRFHMNIIKELYERRTKVMLTIYEKGVKGKLGHPSIYLNNG